MIFHFFSSCNCLFIGWPLSVTSVAAWRNSSAPSAAYTRQCTASTLVQVMACRLFGAKP